MMVMRVLVIGGMAAALAVPAGAAAAVAVAASPSRGAAGAGAGAGRMPGGTGDPADCPYHNSTEAQQWRAHRAERQQLPVAERHNLAQQHHQRMWAQHAGPTPPS